MLANGKSARTWCCPRICEDQDCDCYKTGKPAQALRYGFEQLLSGSGNNRPKCHEPNYQGAQVQVRDANGNLIDSGYTDASGNVTLNVTGKTGTCTVEVVRSFLETIDYQNGLIDNTADKVSFTL